MQQLVVGIALVLLAPLFVQFIVLKGTREDTRRANEQVADLQRKIQDAKLIQSIAQEMFQEMEHLSNQLDRLKKVLPVEVNKPKLMADIKRYANENGIEIIRLSNNAPEKRDVIIEHPFTYIARGSYHDFGSFFAQLTNYPYILNVKGLHLERLEDDPAYTVECAFILSVYTYDEPTEEELKEQIKAKKAERKNPKNKA
jgi:type IV pilus assembly protein PilO